MPAIGPGAAPVRVGRYTLLSEVARGGVGVVYRARDEVVGRDVAVKLLHPRLRGSPAAVRRFLEEARITGRLQHPAIPPVFEVGEAADGGPFLAMKLIKGRTLDDLLAAGPAPHFLPAFEAVCQAVGYAHDRGVIHRDLKPANVMVGAFGEVQVMDWGLAKVLSDRPDPDAGGDAGATVIPDPRGDTEGSETQAGSVLGTPAFMAPEQAVGAVGRVDRRADVFGLGGVLCAVLTGRPPFVADTAESTRLLAAQGNVADAFVRLDASGADPELTALAKWCLAPDPAGRPADAGEVARAVAGLRAAAEDRARRAELDRAAAELRVVEGRKRRLLGAGLTAAVLVSLAAGALGIYAKYRDEAQQRAVADGEKLNAQREQAKAVAEATAKEAALSRLTEQQAATEEALVGGLLRPLRALPGRGLTHDEVRALADLAALPDDRLRLRFVERALATPGGPEKLSVRSREVVHSLAGLDRERAGRLRGAVGGWLAAGTGGRRGRSACGMLAAALPGGGRIVDTAATRALAERMTEQESDADVHRLELSELSVLLARLDPAEAAAVAGPFARRLADQLGRASDPADVQRQAEAVAALAGWLDPAEAKGLAGHLARDLAKCLDPDGDKVNLRPQAAGLAALLARLDPAEAAAVAGPPARVLAARLARDEDLVTSFGLSEALKSVAVGLTPAEADPLARAVAERLLGSVKRQPFNAVIYASMLSPILAGLDPATAAAVARPPARALAGLVGEGDAIAQFLAPTGLKELLGTLPPGEAEAVVGPPVRALSDRLAKAGPADTYIAASQGLLMLAKWVGPAEAGRVAGRLASRMPQEPSPGSDFFFEAFVAYARRVDAGSGPALARDMVARLTLASNPVMVRHLAECLAPLARWLTDGQLVVVLKSCGGNPEASGDVLAELSRRAGRRGTPALQAVVGSGVAVAGRPFKDVWEFVEWAEANRPDLDLKSPLPAPKN
jgi:hypothetical protein